MVTRRLEPSEGQKRFQELLAQLFRLSVFYQGPDFKKTTGIDQSTFYDTLSEKISKKSRSSMRRFFMSNIVEEITPLYKKAASDPKKVAKINKELEEILKRLSVPLESYSKSRTAPPAKCFNFSKREYDEEYGAVQLAYERVGLAMGYSSSYVSKELKKIGEPSFLKTYESKVKLRTLEVFFNCDSKTAKSLLRIIEKHIFSTTSPK